MNTLLDIYSFNWHSLLFGGEDSFFLFIVLFRTVAMFIVVLVSLRILGKRGVKQLSVFELVIILTLGPAAGDPMLYNHVGLLDSLLIFVPVVLLYRLTIYLASRNRQFTLLIKGKPAYLVQDGKICIDEFKRQPTALDEFFTELRLKGVSQPGQVKAAVPETSGEISIFFYADEDVQWGLCLLPKSFMAWRDNTEQHDIVACLKCAQTKPLPQALRECPSCGNTAWAEASNEKRVA